jgi:hypothetical protein
MEIPSMPRDEVEQTPAAEAKSPPRHHSPFGPIGATLRHRWPDYILEVFVIVFSISISFALDQWKERRHDEELERLYLKTLSDNLASDIDALHEIIPETRLVIGKAQSLLAESHASTPIASTQLEAGIRDIARRPSFFAHDAAFSDLRSSGNLRILHDFKLKNALFDYYGLYESIKAKEAAERESLITLVAPYLIRKISIGGGTGESASLRNDREFGNVLWVRVHERSELLADYERETALAEKLRRRIARDVR